MRRLTLSRPLRNLIIRFLRAPVAQLDRVLDYESRGRMFESCRVYQLISLVCNKSKWNKDGFLAVFCHVGLNVGLRRYAFE